KLRRNIHLLPLRMGTGVEQRRESGEKRVDGISDIAITLRNLLEVCGDQHDAHCHGLDRQIRGHETRIIGSVKARWDIGVSHSGDEWHGEEMEPAIGFEVVKERSGLSGYESQCRELASLQLLERHLLAVVCHCDR